jgi:ribosomal protein S18 acetylase RimI-like enzyme
VSDFAIRPASMADAPALADLLDAMNSLDGAPPARPMAPEPERRDLIGVRACAPVRLASTEAGVVGFATAGTIYDAPRHADILMLLDPCVAPEARRRGIARALMAALAAEGRRRGAAAICWGVDVGHEEARLFYRSTGARTEAQFSGELLDGEAMRRLAGEAR